MKITSKLLHAFLAATLLTSLSTRGADLVWIGGTANWNVAGNWSPAQVPTAADNAFITNAGTYTVTAPAGSSGTAGTITIGGASGVQTLAIDRATLTIAGTSVINANGELDFLVAQSVLTGAGNLTVKGLLNWANGTMSGAGTTTIGSGGVMAIGSGGVTLGRSLNNSGTGTWSGGNLAMSANAVFNNSGTFDITADGRLNGGATTAINNSAVFRQTAGTAGTVVTSPFNNSGTLTVLTATLSLNTGGTHTGTFSTVGGATLDLGGGTHILTSGSLVSAGSTLTLSGSAALSASGTFGAGSSLTLNSGVATLAAGCDVTAATLAINGANCVLDYKSAGTVASVSLSQGVLGGTSSITVTGPLTLGGGTITNALVTANGGLTIDGNTTINGGKLVNPGLAIWSAGNFTGANGAVFSNLFGATFVNTFDGLAASGAGATPLFINAGVFAKTNGTAALGTTSIDFQFLNTGTVEVQTNALRYSLNQQTAGLTLLDGGGVSAQGQPLQLLGGTLTGIGPITVPNTQNLINSATISPGLPLGELDISGNYQQTSSGALIIELGGYSAGTNFDLVTVAAGGAGGVATLGGTLNVALVNGFSPTNGATFTFLTASSRAGAFAVFHYPSNDIGMQVSYDLTSAKVTVSNLKPVVANPISDPAPMAFGLIFNFQFAANTFTDPDGDPLTYTAAGMPPGINFSSSTRTFSGTPTQAGIFPVTVSATDSGTPALTATNTFNIVVNPAPLTIAAQARTKTYGAVDPPLTFTVSGLQFTDTQASVLIGALTRAAGESVSGGPYTIGQGTLTASGNYTISFTGSTLAVTPAPLTVTAQPKAKSYGAADPALTFAVSGLQFSDTQATVLTGTAARAAGETVAGSPYAITQGTLAANANYSIGFSGNALSVTPATLTITAQAKTKTYGATDPALTFTVSGLQFSDTQVSVLTGALTRAAGESVAGGPYAISKGTLAANANYTIDLTGNLLTITSATLTITAQAKTKTYGAADPATTFAVSGLQFTDTQASVLTGAPARAAGETVAGSPYAVSQGTLVANANYTLNFTGNALTITPAALTITAQAKSKTYGSTDPGLTITVSGLQFSDTQASVLTGAPTRAAGETVLGSPYAITQGTLAANSNYTVGFTGNTLTITTATLTITAQAKSKIYGATDPALTFTVGGLQFTDTQASVLTGAPARATGETVAGSPYAVSQGTLVANANYTLNFTGNALTITPAALTITAQAKTKTYGAVDPALTFAVSGLQFSDTQTSVLAGAPARVAGEIVLGSPYAITQGTLAANSNYTVGFTGNTLTITPATLTVTAQAKTKTYGATDPALTFTMSGLQFTDTQASVLTGAPARATGETVAGSPYAISQGTLVANANYTIGFTGNTLTITAASLTITAQAKSKIYGATDPALSFTVGGLQFTDTQASVLIGSLTRAPGESVAGGPYAITQGTLSANANYTVRFTGTTLAIIPAPLSIIADSKAKINGAADPVFTVSYLGFVNGETATVLGGTLVMTRAPGEGIGSYQVTPGGLSSPNYAITFVPGTLIISGAPSQPKLTISVSNGTNFLLSWNATSNTTYRIQFKSDLSATSWTDLPGDVVAAAGIASKSDTLTSNKFYRIRVLP